MSSSANPFFSIIVPVYNVEPYLGECLDSVLAQTFGDFECLCADDGSRDGSGALLDAYARRDPRFRITHQPNAGVSSARNRGMGGAIGEYIAFIDGDDFISCEYLVAFYREISRDGGVDIVMGKMRREEIVGWSDYVCHEKAGVFAMLDGQLISDFCLMQNTFSWGRCFCRRIIKEHRIIFPLDIKFSEDMVFFYRFLRYVSKIGIAPCACYNYRRREGAASRMILPWRSYITIAHMIAKEMLQLFRYYPRITSRYRREVWQKVYYGHRFFVLKAAYLTGLCRPERMMVLDDVFKNRDVLHKNVKPKNRMKRIWWNVCLILPVWALDFVFFVCALHPKLRRFFPN